MKEIAELVEGFPEGAEAMASARSFGPPPPERMGI